MKWQYTTEHVWGTKYEFYRALERKLEEMGDKDWELAGTVCEVHAGGGERHVDLIFKRPKQ